MLYKNKGGGGRQSPLSLPTPLLLRAWNMINISRLIFKCTKVNAVIVDIKNILFYFNFL